MPIIQNPKVLDVELYNAILHLLPQLNDQNSLPTYSDMVAFLNSPNSELFIARNPDLNDPIVGMLTLVLFHSPSGLHAQIEDVVVDKEVRRHGIANALLQASLVSAKNARAKSVVLTSNPRRTAANELYGKVGFEKWDTNLYYYDLE
jgi:ribosomal protein S18 acetylase RimI-like enzyme